MPLLLDSREGSGFLLNALSKRLNGQVRIAKPDLPSGDCCWLGCGPNDTEITVGVEIKTFGDALSSIRSERLFDQVNRMITNEQYDIVCLIVWGYFRPDENGILETVYRENGRTLWKPYLPRTREQREKGGGKNAFRYYSELDNSLNSLALQRNVIVKRATSESELVQQIVNLYNRFQTPWSSHTSVDSTKLQSGILPGRPSVRKAIAAALPGVSSEISRHIARKFRTSVELLEFLSTASVEELAAVSWKSPAGRNMTLGPSKSQAIWSALRSE